VYLRINELVPRLKRQETEESVGDFSVDEKGKQVHLAEAGHEHVERLMLEAGLLREAESLYDTAISRLMASPQCRATRALPFTSVDVEYIVRGGEVIIVDEFTGPHDAPDGAGPTACTRPLRRRRVLRVREENQTVASITFQNYFSSLQEACPGMTGTADTEARSSCRSMVLEVVVIPTHRPMIRKDHPDFVYLTQKDKFEAIIEDHGRTAVETLAAGCSLVPPSIETSEFLSGLLNQQGIGAPGASNAKQPRTRGRTSSRRQDAPAR